MNEDELDSKSRDFGNKDATECIGEGSVDADEGEGSIERFIFVKFDSKFLRIESVSWGWVSQDGECVGVPFRSFPSSMNCLRRGNGLENRWM